ncbi:MAG TPA: response regulator [Thermoanaerobaculia bacterium]|nr:response regulator [Thermoanaerobaculia bacterium]
MLPEENLPILVVDDDDATQKLVQALLRRHGYATVLAANGGQAIELLRVRRFSMIVLDMMMPHVSGHEVIEFLARESIRVPVVVCTAAPPKMTSDLNAAIVKAVIRKPFDIDDFVATVTSVAGSISVDARLLLDDDELRNRRSV